MKKTLFVLLIVAAIAATLYAATQQEDPARTPQTSKLMRQTRMEAEQKSRGCESCHQGIEPMHASQAVRLGCTDCHGGDASVMATNIDDKDAKRRAHVQPRNPEIWRTSANPINSYTALLKESPEFVKFVNPGDLRISKETCGDCHPQQAAAVPRSTMTTAAVFWAAVSYANGIVASKTGLLGESYNREGQPQIILPAVPPNARQQALGALPMLVPLPTWEVMQPGEYFRAFERGGINNNTMPPEIGNPNPGEEAGKPDIRLSNRGRGTGSRISPGVINLTKTRLNDPHLSFLGTNDHPGDYRSSGCSACHVVYANDRDWYNSGQYAKFGHQGLSQTGDKTIPKNEKGHPLKHQFTRAVPTSQCMSCHMHQPNSFINTYLGYLMWDYETDGDLLWPKQQLYPTAAERRERLAHNPEGAVVRGLWYNIDFLEKVSELNPQAKNTQFADYHGHGWNFMGVFKRDRKGNLLDKNDNVVNFNDPDKFKKAVHLKDIHLEKGMHCADCHFSRDEHGDGQMYSEYAANIEIECQDCHGNIERYTNLRTSGPLAPVGGTDLSIGVTPFGRRRFAWVNGVLYQRSMVNPEMEWPVVQVKDTITPGNRFYNERSHYAKTIQKGGEGWGPATNVAHTDDKLACFACHSSWMTSCFGCHLPQEQNARSEMQHYEGTVTRNYASYNPQVLRTDVFMIGKQPPFKGAKIAPVRSSSAMVISSVNPLRQRIYIQQAPIAASGYSSQAFNTHVPHTVRSRETQPCGTCHITDANDNNAWLAQTYLQGTNFVNFVGRYAWVATGKDGFEGVAVTEWEEPQAVIGSYLHKVAYPDWFKKHQARKMELEESHHHHGDALMIEHRGEWVFCANGEKGFEVYDVANVDNKDFSERIVSAPVSPIGQRTFVKTKFAAAVALPTNMPIDPTRQTANNPKFKEQPWHPLYRYAYIADKEEGLILVDVTTLADAIPSNNYFSRAVTFNPEEQLKGAESIYVAGRWVFMGTDNGLAVIDIDKPTQPKIVAMMPQLKGVNSIGVQFRYAFATDGHAIHTIDITDPTKPRLAASLPLKEARRVYIARTYAYVAGGHEGVIIVDITNPEKPFVDQTYNAEGELEDVHDVKVASTNASTFAYVADGEHGLKVLQLSSPEWGPTYAGFSPRPMPHLIAKKHTHGPALYVAKGMDRDRAADESGNQVSIFNRVGARPLTVPELQRLYMRNGRIYTVSDKPTSKPRVFTASEQPSATSAKPVTR